jgi:hypothetical protein
MSPIEPLGEIGPEGPLGHGFIKVLVHGGDDTPSDGNGSAPSNALDHTFLQHPQKRRLSPRDQICLFIQE